MEQTSCGSFVGGFLYSLFPWRILLSIVKSFKKYISFHSFIFFLMETPVHLILDFLHWSSVLILPHVFHLLIFALNFIISPRLYFLPFLLNSLFQPNLFFFQLIVKPVCPLHRINCWHFDIFAWFALLCAFLHPFADHLKGIRRQYGISSLSTSANI